MNRKIFAILTLCVVAIGMGAVSAFDLGDLMGGVNETVTIDGIDFNVPSGFQENTSLEYVNQSNSVGGVDYILNGKSYTDGSTAMSILVADYSPYNVTDDALRAAGGNKTTIKGIDGYKNYDGEFYVFNYEKNNKMVILTTDNENVIGDFLIA